MFKLSELAVPVVAAALLVLAFFYGLFHVTVGGLLGVALVAVVAAYVGLMLGRRSETANLYADKIKAEIDEIRARAESVRASFRQD